MTTPITHDSITKRFQIGGTKGYFVVMYEGPQVTGLSIIVSRTGSTLRSMFSLIADGYTEALNRGMTTRELIDRLKGQSFDPCGICPGDTQIESAQSILDYIGRWLEHRFCGEATC